MKRLILTLAAAPFLAPSAWSDVNYSGYQNVAIPFDLNGAYLNPVTGTTYIDPYPATWDTAPWINPFFGGVDIANSALLRPVITGTDQIVNLGTGTLINGSSNFVAGESGSSTHVGAGAGQFTLGTPGNIGFEFEASVGGPTRYGWMNTTISNSGAGVIRDWAYDNAGGGIVIGRVEQSAPSGGAQNFTLSPGTGESFTLGSAITDTGNINSVIKTGDGTTTLVAANAYTGTTAVNQGTLVINGDQAAAIGSVTIGSLGKLSGTGTVGGATTTINGTLDAGLTFNGTAVTSALAFATGSIFDWDINATGSASPTVVEGNLSGANAVFRIALDDFNDVFWTTDHSWSLTTIFGTSDITGTFATIFPTLNTNLNAVNGGRGFTISGSTLSFAAVPEPTGAGVGLLLGAAVLRRRRSAGKNARETTCIAGNIATPPTNSFTGSLAS